MLVSAIVMIVATSMIVKSSFNDISLEDFNDALKVDEKETKEI